MLANIKNLETIFKKMSEDGFDLNKPLKWGFFFFDANKIKLEKVFEELKDHQYKKEDFSKTEDGKWKLHVSKIDILTVDKLHKRNIAFNELASHCDVELYDGWDVEKI